MVIVCSKCQTRFHVDDARVPDAGVKVRCSRCKHGFFVRRPDTNPEDAVKAAVDSALESSAPEPSLDLAGSTEPPETPELSAAPAEALGADDDEDDWQFAVEPPAAAADRTRVEERRDAVAEVPDEPTLAPDTLADRAKELRASAQLGEPESSSLADLGSPENWDLLGGSTGDARPAADAAAAADAPTGRPAPEAFAPPEPAAPEPPVAAAAPARRAAAFADESAHEEPLDYEEAAETIVAPRGPRRSGRAHPVRFGAALHGVGWIVMLALLAALGFGLSRPSGLTSVSAPVAVAGLEARDVKLRVLENASAGPLWLVTGLLVNPTAAAKVPEGALRLVLLGEADAPLDASTVAGLPLDPARLRIEDPDVLRGELLASAASLARRRLGPGEGVPFQAILPEAHGALAVRLERGAPPPLPAPAPVQVEEEADASEPAGEGEAPAVPAVAPSA